MLIKNKDSFVFYINENKYLTKLNPINYENEIL